MRRPSSYVRRDGDTDMNSTMTPMIDVVFLLLVFFVWTASFQIVEKVMKSEMSSEMGTNQVEQIDPIPEQDFEKIIVKIGYDGQQPNWRINNEQVESLDQIQAHLASIAKVKLDATVIIRPDGLVPLGYVIEAYDASKIIGFQKVSFAVNQLAN